MECAYCRQTIPEGEECHYSGKILCENCYIRAAEPLRTCDVAAVHSAKTHRQMAGQTGLDGLTDQQKAICEFVARKGKATKEELCHEFGISAYEIDKQIAILRHCEILKGRKLNNGVYVVPYDLE